ATIQAVSYGVGYGVTAIVLAVAGMGLWSLIWAQIGQAVLETTMMLLSRRHRYRPRFDHGIARAILTYSLGHSLSRIANNLGANGDNFVIGGFLDTAAVGLYSRAYRLMALPANLISDAVGSVLLSTISKIQEDRQRLR